MCQRAPLPLGGRHRPRFARLAASALLAWAAACQSWRVEPVPHPGTPARGMPTRVRATRADGSQLELQGAHIAGDTLRGMLRTPGANGRREVAVPLDSVQRLEARRTSALRTGGLAVGILAGALAASILIALSMLSNNIG